MIMSRASLIRMISAVVSPAASIDPTRQDKTCFLLSPPPPAFPAFRRSVPSSPVSSISLFSRDVHEPILSESCAFRRKSWDVWVRNAHGVVGSVGCSASIYC